MCTLETQKNCVNAKMEPVKDHCPPGECRVETIYGQVFNIWRCVKCGCEEWL